MSSVMTVSQLNRYISFKFREDKSLKGILISGEISNFTNHAKTGHFYFTLKDGSSAIKAVMFNNMASRLGFMPESGMKVIVSANVQVFERDGVYQLYVNDMQPDGVGALYFAFEQLKKKLSEEGIFDEQFKKPLPTFPQKIGIVTSPDAAALQDMLNIISRRYSVVEITIYPCLVQGKYAADSICSSLANADNSDNDIIIVGRGGGSLEDLMAFNSENVARCIFKCQTPVISAIGHETDTTIADYAADLRAPTPSAAAELAVPEIGVLRGFVDSAEKRLAEILNGRLSEKRNLLDIMEQRLNAMLPVQKISSSKSLLDEKKQRLDLMMKNSIVSKRALINEKTAALDNLSPLKIMNRGYSLVYKDEKIVGSAGLLKSGDNVTIRLSDGSVKAQIV
ncbi:MAG: exodeoxyribonuclease VII large subunit [Oscillospiraceae bacterium]|nr:exodeoxyribonuclease VII large subunit [Oscillospiraceae bacterium]